MNIPLLGQGLKFSYLAFLLGNIIMSPGCDVKHVTHIADCKGEIGFAHCTLTIPYCAIPCVS